MVPWALLGVASAPLGKISKQPSQNNNNFHSFCLCRICRFSSAFKWQDLVLSWLPSCLHYWRHASEHHPGLLGSDRKTYVTTETSLMYELFFSHYCQGSFGGLNMICVRWSSHWVCPTSSLLNLGFYRLSFSIKSCTFWTFFNYSFCFPFSSGTLMCFLESLMMSHAFLRLLLHFSFCSPARRNLDWWYSSWPVLSLALLWIS